MAYFTEAFHQLDYGNKGYILIHDFKNEMLKYISVNADSEKTLNKLMRLLKPSEDDRVYYEDFISAIQEIEYDINEQQLHSEDKGGNEYCHNSDFSPFINDGDSYSTGDSGFDNEYRVCQDSSSGVNSSVGKQNRKLIKKIQQIDTIQSKEIVSPRGNQNEFDNCNEVNARYSMGEFSLPLEDMNSSFNGRRRQSDFVTCNSRKVSNRKKHNIEEDAYSLNCWGPCSGSAADLFYHDSMTDIQSTLQKLERSMENLQNVTTDTKHSKNKRQDENYFLTGQIQSLEEKFRESQKQFEQDLYLEREMARRNQGRLEKSKLEEIEYLKWSLKSREEELESQRKELNISLTENERLKYDKLRSDDMLMDLQQQMTNIEAEMRRLKDFHGRELNVLISERNTLFARSAKHSDANSNKNNQKQDELSRLRSENCDLKRRLDECEGEILAISVQQGHIILQSTTSDSSWMQEIDGYSKDEVINLLVKEKDGNFRLREYVNRILTRIIDKDPSLLEI